MDINRLFFLVSILVLGSTFQTQAQTLTDEMAVVKAEVKTAAMKEQLAFKAGNCDQVMALMHDDITFLANGRRAPSKQMIQKFCGMIKRPFKTATKDSLEIYPLSATTAYVIRFLEYPNSASTKIQEYVTKIWTKTNNTWKIKHLQSTVKEVALE